MGIDFKLLKKYVKEVVDTVDHRDLNEHPAFQTINPSSEHIAKYIYDQLLPKLASDRYRLYSVGVSETETSSLIYSGQ
jgi:6-pyruvoyltetrahydropterin/6-carboxytetrahydropterin synthase